MYTCTYFGPEALAVNSVIIINANYRLSSNEVESQFWYSRVLADQRGPGVNRIVSDVVTAQ